MATSFAFKPIVTDGLIFNLDALNRKCYSGTGSSCQDSINGITASLNSGVIFDGSSFIFDGVDDYIEISGNNPPLSTLTTYTMELWILATYSGNNVILEKGANTKMLIQPSSQESIFYGDYTLWTSTDVVLKSYWSNLTVVQSSTNRELWINGELKTSSVGSNVSANSNNIVLMSRYGSNAQVGKVSSLRIWNKTLQSSDVIQNYNALKNRFI